MAAQTLNPDSDLNNGSLKRPCCKLLRELTDNLPALATPQETDKVLATISKHCVCMKLAGKSKTKIDFSTGNCFIAVSPDEAAGVLIEAQKTAEVYPGLEQYDELVNKINEVLAHNADRDAVNKKDRSYVADMREKDKGERKFGAVPFTDINKDQNISHGLSAGELLKAHPALADAAQFQGDNPKDSRNTQDNPEAAKKAEQLQLDYKLTHQHQLQHSNAPKPRPT